MPKSLKTYLHNAYATEKDTAFPWSNKFIQIDDQNDNDNIQTFCNIFLTFLSPKSFELELNGKFPITPKIRDICEIYQGYANIHRKRITLRLDQDKCDVIDSLTEMLKETSLLGDSVDNREWEQMCARTISSLKRLSRTLRAFKRPKTAVRKNIRQALSLLIH